MHFNILKTSEAARVEPVTSHTSYMSVGSVAGGGDRVPPEAWQELSAQDDPHDSELYKAARKLFVTRLHEHGLFDFVTLAGS